MFHTLFDPQRALASWLLLGAAWPGAVHAAVVISAAPTRNVTCTGGSCAPIAPDAVLNVTDLENMLQSSSLALATTGSGGVEANDISTTVPFSWGTASMVA